jgi:four helix bundle protein
MEIYKVTSLFPDAEKFGLVSQLRRAAVSIPSNIAEGCGKLSQADFANFLQIALGSVNETEYLLLLSNELGYFPSEVHNDLEEKSNKIRAMLISLLKKVRTTV